MKLTIDEETLRVTDVREIDEDQADEIIEAIRASLTPEITAVSVDLAQLRTINGNTAGLLRSIQEEFDVFGGLAWHMLNPPPEARQLFELVRLHHLFEINPPRAHRLIHS